MSQDSLVGRTIAHYRVLKPLGEGGMGVVYLAEDVPLRRNVALKFIRTEAGAAPEDTARFLQEARSAAGLDDPHITIIHEILEAEGRLFIAMEYLDGQTLRDRIAGGPLDLAEALDLALQVTDGLRAAHARGIIHRDIKTSNIMVTRSGTAKIMDFGLARPIGGPDMTRTAAVVGTVAYMSPEQAAGEEVDERTDIWSLGVVLFEMMTGRRPFSGDNERAVLKGILAGRQTPLGSVRKDAPAELERIVDKCLEKKPSRRYQNASALKADLERLRQAFASRTLTLGAAGMPRPGLGFYLKKHRGRAWAGLGALVLVVLASSFFTPLGKSLGRLLGISRAGSQLQLAVLPFDVIGGDDKDKAFSQGLVELLTSKLTQVQRYQGSLRLVPAIESRQLDRPTAGQARKVLRADRVFSGTILFIADNVTVTLNLIDADKLRQLKSRDISRPRTHWTDLPDDLSEAAIQMLDMEAGPEARKAWAAESACRPEAATLYIQAKGYLQRYERVSNVDIAISLLQQARDQDVDCAVVYAGLGEAFWYKYSLRLGEASGKELIDKIEGVALKALELKPDLCEAHVIHGVLFRLKGQYAEAVKELERATRLDPLNAPAMLELGSAYEELGRLKDAEEAYIRAIDLEPDSWSGYQYLGVFYYYHGQYAQAEKNFLRITEYTPDNWLGFLYLGDIYLARGGYSEAISQFEKSIAIVSTPDALSNLGTCYFYLKRYRDAAQQYQKAIDLGSNTEYSWGNLGDACRLIPGFEDKARTAYEHAAALARDQLRLNPKKGQMLKRLARYDACLGKRAEAIDEIERAGALSPGDTDVLQTAVEVYETAGDRPKALAALKELSERSPEAVKLLEDNPALARLCADPRFSQIAGNRNKR